MARLIPGSRPPAGPDRPGCEALFINGIRYANTATKFWADLIDEVRTDFPDCSAIELSAPSGELLGRKHLYPQIAFSESLQRLMQSDLSTVMQQSVAEMEIFGPPASVRIRLLADNAELLTGELPPDCLDEDILTCLLAWLLEWAGIQPAQWNQELSHGDFSAEDPRGGQTYAISFCLVNRHISEGLHQRTLSLSAL